MKTYDFDALVIGSGCAGYNCADWLYDLGVKNIALVTESRLAGTSRNTGSDKQTYYKLSLAGDGGDSIGEMAKTLFAGGGMDGPTALCEAAGSVPSFLKLCRLGVDFPTNAFGEYVGYKTDHDPCARGTSIGPYTSKRMTEVLEASVMGKGIPILDGLQAVRLLTDGEGVAGVLCLDRRETGKASFVAIRSPYVVLATGGPAGLYAHSVYPPSQTGSSALALEAGAEFANLAEWQFGLASTKFRWNLSGTYQQVLPRYISVDSQGVEREFLLEHFPSPGEMLDNIFRKGYQWPFDVRKLQGSSFIDLLVYRESVVLGRKVYLDFTREPSGLESGFGALDGEAYTYLKNSDALVPLPIERLRRMNPGAISLYADHGIDITREPLEIAVCAQHNNGGVRVDEHWKTTVPGLYAVGEAAGTLGVFRPGGTALNSCQVGSMRAARHIAEQGDRTPSDHFEALARQALAWAEGLTEGTHGERSTLGEQERRCRERMSRDFGFLRDLEAMERSLTDLAKDVASFQRDNRWEKPTELPRLFQNYDSLLMSQAVAGAMAYTARTYGSRGSSFVLRGGDFMDRDPLPEQEEGRDRVVVLRKEGQAITLTAEPVKPIPDRELWFETVWKAHQNRKNKSKKEEKAP